MSPAAGFVAFFLVTLAFLAGVVASGRKGARRVHVRLVAGAVLSLGITIFYAEQLGDRYDLESAGWITPFHLSIAKATTAAYLLPVFSGIRLWRRDSGRGLHRALAYAVLALTLATAASGTAMILSAEPLGESGPAPRVGP